ncbi:MAG: alkaline phosphatase D family protein [Ferruginibacter sp.]
MPFQKFLLAVVSLLLIQIGIAQTKSGLVSGPWAGNVELRTASIWLEVGADVRTIAVQYSPVGSKQKPLTVLYKGEAERDFSPVKVDLHGLDINTEYAYTVSLNGKTINTGFKTTFKTKDLWQFRKPAPDFSFLTGSCAYFNEPVYDRPGKPYGGDSSIFETMATKSAAFHLWLGDNWYTREVDYSAPWGLNYRASRDRSFPILQAFMASMPQYAIWDDHDFGPNDGNGSYIFKDESRKVFMNYWLNPSYGEEGKGIYTRFSYSDVDFFLLDDRFFRSADDLPDSVNGKPNERKIMYGAQQMKWLENALATSNATFKIIATGSQVLNPNSPFDCVKHFPVDYSNLMSMLSINKINGVMFLTGDRHHTEIIAQERKDDYTLYDITVSPYTSGTHSFSGIEKNNPARILGIDQLQNFGQISVSGKRGDRVLKTEFYGIKGEKLGEWSINEKALKSPKK